MVGCNLSDGFRPENDMLFTIDPVFINEMFIVSWLLNIGVS